MYSTIVHIEVDTVYITKYSYSSDTTKTEDTNIMYDNLKKEIGNILNDVGIKLCDVGKEKDVNGFLIMNVILPCKINDPDVKQSKSTPLTKKKEEGLIRRKIKSLFE